jgi:hypothetical protein
VGLGNDVAGSQEVMPSSLYVLLFCIKKPRACDPSTLLVAEATLPLFVIFA